MCSTPCHTHCWGHLILWLKPLLSRSFGTEVLQDHIHLKDLLETFSTIATFHFLFLLSCSEIATLNILIYAENGVSLVFQSTPCRKIYHKASPDCILQIYFHISCHAQQRRNHVDFNTVTIHHNKSAVTVCVNSFISFQKEKFTNKISLCSTNLYVCILQVSIHFNFCHCCAEGPSQHMCFVMSLLKKNFSSLWKTNGTL